MNYKKVFAPLILACSSLLIQAQTPATAAAAEIAKPKTGLKNVQFHFGTAWDQYGKMDMSAIEDRTQNSFEHKNKTQGMTQNVSYSSGGLSAGLNLGFHAPKLSNEFISSSLRFGGSVNLFKESLIDFHNHQAPKNETSSMMYCFIENEAKLSSDLLFEIKANRILSLYSGFGLNASGSFGNQLLIFEDHNVNPGVVNEFTPNGGVNENKQTISGKNVIYTRAYIPMGFNLKLYKNLESTFEVKLGRGIEKVIDGKLSGFKTREVSLGLKYNFNL